jgi:hypothetical protein
MRRTIFDRLPIRTFATTRSDDLPTSAFTHLVIHHLVIHHLGERSDAKDHYDFGCRRPRARNDGIGQRPNPRRFEPQRAGAKRHDYPQGRLQRLLGPLVPAGSPPRLRPVSLLVRALLVSERRRQNDREAAFGRPLFSITSARPRAGGDPVFEVRPGFWIPALAGMSGSNYSSSTTAPSRIVTRRSICAAMSRLWVAMMVARPEARTNWLSAPKTRSDVR